jgi:hypothetical protein
MLAGLWKLPQVWHKRRQIQAMRTVPIDALEAMLWPPQ